MLLACGSAGLMAYRGEWRRLETPLGSADMLACGGGRTVVLDCAVDDTLLGGITVELDGKVLDGSLRHRLHEVKEVMEQ